MYNIYIYIFILYVLVSTTCKINGVPRNYSYVILLLICIQYPLHACMQPIYHSQCTYTLPLYYSSTTNMLHQPSSSRHHTTGERVQPHTLPRYFILTIHIYMYPYMYIICKCILSTSSISILAVCNTIYPTSSLPIYGFYTTYRILLQLDRHYLQALPIGTTYILHYTATQHLHPTYLDIPLYTPYTAYATPHPKPHHGRVP